MKKLNCFLLMLLALNITACKNSVVTSSEDFIQKLSIERTYSYLEEFQKIADANNNNRAVGSSGGIASTEFIVQNLEKLGLKPTIQEFTNSKGKLGKNVIVELDGLTDKITMVGAHYDSVEFGPGINDNATGVAVLLEIISQLKEQNIKGQNTLRFVFWDSEETYVEGSKFYVKQLSDIEKQKIAHYINVDMVGTKSPNILITDGDGSSWKDLEEKLLGDDKTEQEKNDNKQVFDNLKNAFPVQVKGAEKLESLYSSYLEKRNVSFQDDYLLSNSTDVYPFLGLVPTFGIVMTNEQEDESGASLYAPCYHQACDTIENVDKNSLKLALETISELLYEIAIK